MLTFRGAAAFNVGITFAILIASGNTPSEKDLFIILHKGSTIIGAANSKSLAGILEDPEDLLISKLLRIWSISSSDVCVITKSC